MNAMSTGPPKPTAAINFGRPLAYVVVAPVLGSTRAILPAALSVTYSAPSGPMVLPEPPSRPVTSRDAVAFPEGGAEALAADGANIAIKATDNSNSFLGAAPMRLSPMGLAPFPAASSTPDMGSLWSATVESMRGSTGFRVRSVPTP